MPALRPRLVAAFALAIIGPGVLRAADPPAAPAAAPAQPPAPLPNLGDFKRWVIAADYTTDGATLVTAGGESLLYRPGDVVVWNADGSRVGDLAGHPTAVWAVQISKDGALAATAGYDGLVKLWDLPAKAGKHDLRKHKGWVRSLAFSPDGTKLATAGEDGTVVLWNTADGQEIKTVAAHAGPVTAVAFSPDGATIATGGGDKLVKLWNAADGAEKGKLEGHGDALWSLAYSPDGSRLASGGADRTIKLWTTSDSKEFATLKGHKDWVTSVAFSADGTRLVSGSLDGAVKFWDVNAKGEQEGPPAEKSSVWCVTFSPDDKNVFVGTHAGGKLIATPAAKLLPPPPPPPAPPAPPPQPTTAVLVPTEFKSAAGAAGAIAADGFVTVTGNRAKDTYTLTAAVPAGGTVKAITLEAATDPSLPQQGPGRADNGNFVLSTFRASFGPAGSTEAPTPVRFTAAKATHEQPDYVAAGTIDDKPETGWAIAGGVGKPQAITFDVAPDTVPPAGGLLVVVLDQQYPDGQHTLGKIRLSAIQEPVPPAPAPPAK
ncbi:MAG: WD40 repeat domain-containing protein [Planctomycetes bacterium]|nr:WD40 repeat domain-containing protein [Planctomycetota bacterium]